MRTLFRGGRVVSTLAPGAAGISVRPADVLVEDAIISVVGECGPEVEVDTVVDATDHLLMPGLVNGHLHSWEGLFRGRYDCLPLEVWGLLAYPLIADYTSSPRLAYLRTAAVAIESLHNGVTTVMDDLYETSTGGFENLTAVFQAYEDTGMRANCSSRLFDRSFVDAIPYLRDYLGPSQVQALRKRPSRDSAYYLDLCTAALETFHGAGSGRLRYVLAPSGPQRCSPELLEATVRLAEEHDSVAHIHVLETKMQALSGPVFFHRPMLEYMDSLGVLTPRTTIAHAVWVSDEDIDLVAERGVSVVHNPISNLKLGSGLAPLGSLLRAGVPVALGSDGISSNDSARMFEVMKAAALLATLADDDFERWPNAGDVLFAATQGGARSLGLQERIGAIAPGMRADIVMVDTRTSAFTPTNDIVKHLVFAENGSSIRAVMVDGTMVVRDGRALLVDEEAILAELRHVAVEFLRQHSQVEADMRQFAPAIESAYRRVMQTPWPQHRRLSPDPSRPAPSVAAGNRRG